MLDANHHIIVRGIKRSPIYLEAGDQQNVLNRLGIDIAEGPCSDYIWVLMDNHLPILFKAAHMVYTW